MREEKINVLPQAEERRFQMFAKIQNKWHGCALGKYVDSQGGLFIKGSFDTRLFAFLMIALVGGLVMLYSASYPNAYTKGYDPAYYFNGQLQGAVAGVILLLIISKFNYKLFMIPGAYVGSLFSIVTLFLVLFVGSTGDGEDTSDDGNTIRRWLSLGSFSFQPSDVAKLALILTLAYILHRDHHRMVSKKPLKTGVKFIDKIFGKVNNYFGISLINESSIPVMKCVIVILAYIAPVLVGSHLSGAIILALIAAVLLYVGEIRWTWVLFFVVVVILLIPVLFATGLIREYMLDRIVTFFSESPDATGADWQTTQALYAIGSGGFFGKGLGQSVQKYNYVPEPQNDMIFSIVVEELGFIGGAAIVIIFGLMVWRGIAIGVNSPTRYGALVAFGVSFKLAIQVFLNIAVATDMIPNTGITLPFFSYGRTALLVNLVEMGILLSISRASRVKKV